MSFLPDFCVPHKHYCADIIYWMLSLVLLVGHCVTAVSNPFGRLNEAGCSRWCVDEWLRQFKRNSNNLRQFGIPRLLGYRPVHGDPASLLRILVGVAAKEIDSPNHVFRFCQQALCRKPPPFGLFRAVLLPGCVT